MAAPESTPHAAAASPGGSGLARAVPRWHLVALMVNGIVGAGIFGLPSQVHALAGPWGLGAFVLCGAVVAAFALTFAEVASRFALTGGPYLYTRAAFGPLPGFLVGWLMWVTRVSAIAAIAAVMTSYLAFFWPPAAAGAGRVAATCVALAALTALNLVGVGRAARVAVAFTLAKLAPLALFVGLGLGALSRGAFAAPAPPAAAPFAQAVLLLVFAFGGFEAVVIAAGEMRDPRRDMPFALLVAIASTTLLYVLVQVVCIGTLPGLAGSSKPLADAASRFMGAPGAAVIAFGAVASTAGTVFGSLLVGPRVLFALAEQGQLPPVFLRTHARFRTPHVAILVTAAAALALAVTGTFTYLLTLNVLARLSSYLATACALPVLRRRGGDRPAAFTVPGGAGVAAFAIVACLALAARSGARELRDVGIALAAGLALHAADRAARARRAARA